MYFLSGGEGRGKGSEKGEREEEEEEEEGRRKNGKKQRDSIRYSPHRLLPRGVQLPPELLGHGQHLLLGGSGSLGLYFFCVICAGEREREEEEKVREEKRSKRG